jgi:hypothetical protein
MDLSSLPAYPKPEPPAAPAPSGRWGMMVLQALIMLAIWVAIYLMHEYATAIVAAEKKARAEAEAELRRSGIGKWVSTHGDGAVLELNADHLVALDSPEERFFLRQSLEGEFTLLRNGKVLLSGRFHPKWFQDDYCLEIPMSLSHSEFFRYRVVGEELELHIRHRKGLFEGVQLQSGNVARFKRVH